MADSTNQLEDDVVEQTSAIHRLIAATRLWLRSTWVATGLAVSIGLFAAVLVAVVLLDMASPLWPVLRFAGLMLIVVPTIWALFVGVVRPLVRRLTQVMVARRIEQELPSIHNRLVSCVDLSRNGHASQSRSFHQRLVNEAFDRIRGFRLRQVLDLLSLRRASVFAFVSVAAFIIAFFLFSDRLPTAVARIFQPFADIPPVSDVLYDVLVGEQQVPGDCDILRGEDVDFVVLVKKGEVDPPGTPQALRLDVSTVDAEGRRKHLTYGLPAVRDLRTTFKLTGMQRSFTYRVRGGGTWSKQYRVTMLDRPRIVGIQTALHYPEYMRLPEPKLGPPQSPHVTGPRESDVKVTVDVQGDASEGEIQLLEHRVSTIAVRNRRERIWFSDEMPAGAKVQGKWEFDEALVGSRGHTDALNAAAHAHGFERAPTPFEVLSGESLIAYIYLDPEQMPETVMLKFHDGKNWEHRAFWGADKIGEGKLDTPSRHRVGDLPAAGKLVRLEVPAAAVELEGNRIHGISFALFGGKAVWGTTGSLSPATKRVSELVATESFLMSPAASLPDSESKSTKWSGKFTLQRDGFYRVVLRNRLKYSNQQMDEGKLTALPDNAPQLVVERPAKDLVVSEPIKVPVYLTAYDDFGLDDIVLSFQTPDSSSFQGRTVRTYDPPKQNDKVIATIDLAAEGLQLNQTLRYRVEVRDTKGQSVTTEDRTIRIAKDNNAADQQFARHQEKTKSLQENLEQLVQEQAKVETAAEQLAEKYEDLTEAIEQAQAEAVAQAEAAAAANQPPPEPMPVTLDEPAQKQLEELRAELAQVAPIEEKAVQLGKQVASELKQMADQAATLEMLPPEVAEQLKGVQEAFDQLAVKPLEALNTLVKEATQPAKPDPQLPMIQQQAESVQQSLEDLQSRIEAVARAQETSRADVEQAVAELRQDVMQQNARIAARELTELRNAVAEMREELGELGETQEALMADTGKDLSEPLFEKLAEAQDQFDAEAEPVLTDARELLADEMLEQVRANAAEMSDAPAPLQPALARPTNEPPAAEPDPAAAKKKDKAKQKAAKKQVVDAPPMSPERQQLQERQADRAEEIATAEEALAADQEILDSLIESLASQLPAEALGEMTPEQQAQLQELLEAQTTREALEMFRRLEQMLAQANDPTQPTNQPVPPTPPTEQPDLSEIGAVDAILVELDEFDLNARTVIMKMQPREREDLLQGLKEEGPEGYREFIRDYFKRLTKVQAVK